MSSADLRQVGPGFDDEATGSQAVFRAALQALSHPGRWTPAPAAAHTPPGVHRAAALLMLALLDSETSVWLSPRLRQAPVAAWLRFHTGCPLVEEASQARFVWVAEGDDCPALDQLLQGTDQDPDRSATCVLELGSGRPVGEDVSWQLSGPGISGTQTLTAEGVPQGFEQRWQDNHACFPRGVDVFLVRNDVMAGLPRTTRLAAFEEV